MKQLHIGTSPITGKISVGYLLKDGRAFAAGKQDVTGMACGAVAEHAMVSGGSVIVWCNGKPKFEITVIDIDKKD